MDVQLFNKIKDPVAQEWAFHLTAFVIPIFVAAGVAYLLIDNETLSVNTWSWITKPIAMIRSFPMASADEGRQIYKKNQFLKGDWNFDLLAFLLIWLPMFGAFFWFLPISMNYVEASTEENGWDYKRVTRQRTFSFSMLSGWLGVFALTWFLIPVARHSVLLVAMGWSPVQALRFHIWSGHICFFFIFLHTITMIMVWFMDTVPVSESIFPPADCWSWSVNLSTEEHHRRQLEDAGENSTEVSTEEPVAVNEPFVPDCYYQWYNLTGILAMIMFTVLWVSSVNWVRRKNYRLFYLLHVIFGSLMLITSILHYAFICIYWLPSIAYYLASTSPTLIQALASRYRGGVKITKVIQLADAAGCVEVHVATNEEATAALNREPSQFVKLCVPKISIVWHPFTVFAHPTDPTTLRFLFRPVGPFTKELGKVLTAQTKPVTILDGFYKGGNRVRQALSHDCVTIVCGGVAVTPFLSMIPAVLTELSKPTSVDCPVKTISVHWAVRERGLMNHVIENYFAFFQEQARALGKVKLEITVYYTARNPVNFVEGTDSRHNRDSTWDPSESMHYSASKRNTSLEGITEKRKDETMNDSESATSSEDMLKEKSEPPSDVLEAEIKVSGEGSPNSDNTPGFPLEVGRFMVGRFSKAYFNIPVFVAFNFAVWCGFSIIFETYDWNQHENFKQLSATTVMTLVMTVMFGVFGILVEATVLHARTYWPTPTFDNFTVYLPLSDGEKGGKWSLIDSEHTSFNIVNDRPSGPRMLKAARDAEAPGIFTCGPTQMMDMVRHETNQENTWLGRTRFCLYDEPFEF
jgi:predicted ferric reductase